MWPIAVAGWSDENPVRFSPLKSWIVNARIVWRVGKGCHCLPRHDRPSNGQSTRLGSVGEFRTTSADSLESSRSPKFDTISLPVLLSNALFDRTITGSAIRVCQTEVSIASSTRVQVVPGREPSYTSRAWILGRKFEQSYPFFFLLSTGGKREKIGIPRSTVLDGKLFNLIFIYFGFNDTYLSGNTKPERMDSTVLAFVRVLLGYQQWDLATISGMAPQSTEYRPRFPLHRWYTALFQNV
jgi:hypothetical protein